MTYKIYKLDNITNKNRVSEVLNVDGLEWNDAKANVYLGFTLTTTEKLKVGDWIEFCHVEDEVTVFYAIITSKKQNSKYLYLYQGYDFGFYLLKNEVTIQFRRAKISQAMRDVCAKLGFAVGFIPEIPFEVTKIYQGQTIETILKDLYQIAVSKGLRDIYYFDCRDGQLNLFEQVMNNNLKGEIANLYEVDSFDTISSFEIGQSIEEMKNKVEVQSPGTKERIGAVKYEKSDIDNVNKYGLLQTVIEVDATKVPNYKEVAKNKLKELCEVKETASLDVWGNYLLHKGVCTPLKIEILNLDGVYEVQSSTHEIAGTVEKVKITLEKITENV